MGWRIVRQPNGRLARFSDVVDNFTNYNMTEDEAIDLCLDYMGRGDAREKVRRGIEDEPIPPFLEASGRGDGLDRWRDCLDTIRAIHGEDEAAEVEAMMSGTPGEASRY